MHVSNAISTTDYCMANAGQSCAHLDAAAADGAGEKTASRSQTPQTVSVLIDGHH